ncbi:hypothetical protein TNCV_4873691 [Trichonephila clavipes]|nr:hypothetical protein TNCV_4873691 [Trichonephila clavipes]
MGSEIASSSAARAVNQSVGECRPAALEHHAGDSAFCSVPPHPRGRTGGGQGLPTSIPLTPTTREDLRLDGYLKYPHAAKPLYIYLQISMSSPIQPQSLGIANHYTGCKRFLIPLIMWNGSYFAARDPRPPEVRQTSLHVCV